MTHRISLLLFSVLGFPLALACSDSTRPVDAGSGIALRSSGSEASALSHARAGFGFNGTAAGFPAGVVRLTGGGSFDFSTASNAVPTPTSVSASGGFDCVEGVFQGPLTGCGINEGVRWDTAQLLTSTGFKCTVADTPRTAVTDARTAVLLADFYRAGDGDDESFSAIIIISESDLAPDLPGNQTFWVQGVGCGTASVHFNRTIG